MTAKGRFATILIALTVFGCKGPLQTSAASAAEGLSGGSSGDGASGAPSSGGGTRVEYITDPTMDNMNAISVTIPANWHFQGVLMQSGDCGSGTFACEESRRTEHGGAVACAGVDLGKRVGGCVSAEGLFAAVGANERAGLSEVFGADNACAIRFRCTRSSRGSGEVEAVGGAGSGILPRR